MPKMVIRATSETAGVRTDTQTGKHVITTDEPPNLGGTDAGPNPLELMLGALAGCENVIAHMAAKEMAFEFDGIAFAIEAEFDPQGLMGNPDVRTYFERVTIDADVKTEEPDERIQELKEKVDSRCPIFGVLNAADVEMMSNWKRVE